MSCNPFGQIGTTLLDFCHHVKEAVGMQRSLSERVALAIRIEMLRQTISTSELAERLGQTYLWTHRRLKNETPFLLEDLPKFADALRVPMAQLLVEDEVSAA
jgi:hypothetical protein